MAPKVIGKGPNGEDITEVDHSDPKNYVVDRIMGTRIREGSRQFLIRYHDYPTLEWLDDVGLIHCTQALAAFKKTMGYTARGKGKYFGFPTDDGEHMVPPDGHENTVKRIVIGVGPNGEAIVRYEGELDDNDQLRVERVMGARDVGEPPVREFLLKLKDKPDLEWIGEENLQGCENLFVRFKAEVGVEHLAHKLDAPLLVPADKPPHSSHTQPKASSSAPVQDRRSSAPLKQATRAAKQKPGGSGHRPKSLAVMTSAVHHPEKKTVDEDDRELHLQLPEDVPSSSRKRGAAPSQLFSGTDGAVSPKRAADRLTVVAKKASRVEADIDENDVAFEHKEPPASPASVEPPPSSPTVDPHEESLKKIEATHDPSKSDKERMRAIIDYVVETRCLEEAERPELKERLEKVLIWGALPHLVVDEKITAVLVKSYDEICRGANRIIKTDFPKLRDEFAKETRDGKGVVDALIKGQWFERVAAYYFRKFREVNFPVTVAAVEAVGWQLVAPVCPQQRSKMNDEAREFFASTLKKKALAAKIITD